MNNIIKNTLAGMALAFIAVPAAAEEISTYGYCPLSYPSEKLSAQGTGKTGISRLRYALTLLPTRSLQA